jgi:hypothetical protein
LLSLSLSSHPSILIKIKEGYLYWLNLTSHIPKSSRYTIGARIENKFLDLLELSYVAYFTERGEKNLKIEKISKCILTSDTIKYLITFSWEAKLISNKQYEEIALKLDEIGKMLGGWKKSFTNPDKKNHAI